jgi:hypothetical protein
VRSSDRPKKKAISWKYSLEITNCPWEIIKSEKSLKSPPPMRSEIEKTSVVVTMMKDSRMGSVLLSNSKGNAKKRRCELWIRCSLISISEISEDPTRRAIVKSR